MGDATWITIVAALIALGSAVFAGLQVAEARKQTANQLAARRDAADPRLWADIRPDSAQGTLLQFQIGNAGPSTATQVVIEISPELPAIPSRQDQVNSVQARLRDGLSSLTPGQVHRWTLGQGFEILKGGGPEPITVTIRAHGPFGPLPDQQYVISPAEWRDSLDQPEGSLHQIRKAIEALAK